MTKELDIFPAVPMKSTNTRTMWMAPRCIRRVEARKLVQIIKLLDSVQANVETQDQQDMISYPATIKSESVFHAR